MSKFKDLYIEAKGLLKKIQNKGYYNLYTTRDFFYLADETSRGVFVFSEHLYNDGYGIQLFHNNAGLNYLHDILSTETNYPINYFYSDCLLLGFVPRVDLHKDDIAYLKKHNIRLSKDYNLIPLHFKEGYGKVFMDSKDLNVMIKYLYYILALVDNEKEDLAVAFSKNLSPIANFNNLEMTYNVYYNGLPILERMPKKSKVNYALVEDFKDSQYINDTCYFFHTYFPLKGEDNVYITLILAYYINSKKYKFETFEVVPNQIDEPFLGFIDEVFLEYGLPTNVLFNHRKLYSAAYKTLNELNIEVEFNRENPVYDEQIYNIVMEEAKDNVPDIIDGDDEFEIEEDLAYVS